MKTGVERALLEKKMITAEEVQQMKKQALEEKSSFLKVLLATGKVDEEQIQDMMSKRFKVPKLDLDRFEVKKEAVSSLNPQVCRKYQVMPIAKAGGRKIILAMADPGDLFAIEDIRGVAQMQLEIVVATESSIERAIEKYFVPTGDITSFIGNMEETSGLDAESSMAEVIDEDNNIEEDHAGNDSAIIKFVNKMLADAINSGASDIHIEPYEKRLRIRYRVDGTLMEKVQPPQGAGTAIVSRIKIMSRLDIAERRRPQDGRLKVRMASGKEKEIDFRVSVIPGLFGEKVVMRVLDSSALSVDLDTVGFNENDIDVVKDIVSRPQGMVLVTGPTGSGKTTTLYSFLDAMNNSDVNISTAEDPVEFNVDGINQVQVNSDIGFDFASSLRSFLRQDPDIIMVGEIRDLETAQVAFKAASTGHMVLSTLHTNDSVATVSRLVDMGIPSYMVSETVSLVIAQRLMKRICRFCMEDAEVPDKDLIDIGVPEDQLHLYENLKKGKGCHQCNRTGYKGRIPVFEILQMTSEVRKSILNHDSPVDMKRKAVKEGIFTSLRMAALWRLREGVSTVEEVINCSVKDD